MKISVQHLSKELDEEEPDQPAAKGKKTCSHSPDEPDCNKFCFSAMHKGDWDLSVWQDSKIIVCLTNFFSSSRAGFLSRGSKGSKDSYVVWAPEGIWYYNVEGRSPTDGHDQDRTKLSISDRRTVRYGMKGILFVFDILMTNAAIMHEFLAPDDLSADKRMKLTKANFVRKWASDVLDSSPRFRLRTSKGLCLMQGSTNNSTLTMNGSARLAARTEHQLEDAGQALRNQGFNLPGPDSPRKPVPYGKCFYADCPWTDTPGRKTTQKVCMSCKQGKGAYYHLECFFATHRCTFGT